MKKYYSIPLSGAKIIAAIIVLLIAGQNFFFVLAQENFIKPIKEIPKQMEKESEFPKPDFVPPPEPEKNFEQQIQKEIEK